MVHAQIVEGCRKTARIQIACTTQHQFTEQSGSSILARSFMSDAGRQLQSYGGRLNRSHRLNNQRHSVGHGVEHDCLLRHKSPSILNECLEWKSVAENVLRDWGCLQFD